MATKQICEYTSWGLYLWVTRLRFTMCCTQAVVYIHCKCIITCHSFADALFLLIKVCQKHISQPLMIYIQTSCTGVTAHTYRHKYNTYYIQVCLLCYHTCTCTLSFQSVPDLYGDISAKWAVSFALKPTDSTSAFATELLSTCEAHAKKWTSV